MGSQIGYYSVRVENNGRRICHTVYAHSDYDAAVKVRKATGEMAQSQDDVSLLTEEDLSRVIGRIKR